MDYVKYYAAPLLLLIGVAGFILGGDWVWLGFSTFGMVIVIDTALPRDLSTRRMSSPFWAGIPIWIGALGPIAVFFVFARRIAIEPLGPIQLIGGTLTCVWFALVPGIAAQHELFHSRNPWARVTGRYAQITLFDGMRDVEHVIYHHIDVSTPADLSTAVRGTSIYAYTAQTVPAVIRYSLEAECAALQKRGFSRWNYRHRVWKILLVQFVFQSIVYAIGGLTAVVCTLTAMIVARIWVEMFSYFQHYGQTRIPGTPIGKRHVWNHLGVATRLVGLELTNHADHHLDPAMPYYRLRPDLDAIPMPSIFLCFLAALIPPLWETKIIKPALKRWDLEFATPAECAIARQQNLAAGWEDWSGPAAASAGQVSATIAC